MQEGDLRRVIGQVAIGPGLVEGCLDEVWEVRRHLDAWHFWSCGRHCATASLAEVVVGRMLRLGIASMKSYLVRASYHMQELNIVEDHGSLKRHSKSRGNSG